MGNMRYIPIAYKNLNKAKDILKRNQEKQEDKGSIFWGIEEWEIK